MSKENKQQIVYTLNEPSFKYRHGNIVWYEPPEEYNDIDSSIQKGRRKGLIISNDANNVFSPNVHIVPITTKHKKFVLHVPYKGQHILCEQITPINKKWVDLEATVESIDAKTLSAVKDKIMIHFNI